MGVGIGYATTAAELADNLALAQAADEFGYATVWAAEAYGSDAVSVLTAVAARTRRIGIGSAVLQIPGRTPAMTAMTAATLDALSDGRFSLGLGVSGAQVSEGWHGVRYADPIGRTREYIGIVRQALGRRRVVADGEHFTLPLPDGPGKSLLLSLRPVRPEVPVYLAALGPANLALTGEIADGWLGLFVDPAHAAAPGGAVHAIRAAAAAAGRPPGAVDLCAQVSVALGPDVATAADRVRGHAALYLGGMGSRTGNVYARLAATMGHGDAVATVQDRYLSRDHAGAAAAVPLEFLRSTSLLGPPGEIGERLLAYRDAGIDEVTLGVFDADPAARITTLRTVLETAERVGVLA
nr:LLM class flavin-dependent oxidoreductase [Nakamurella flavida]